jgi:hypothetical protein
MDFERSDDEGLAFDPLTSANLPVFLRSRRQRPTRKSCPCRLILPARWRGLSVTASSSEVMDFERSDDEGLAFDPLTSEGA